MCRRHSRKQRCPSGEGKRRRRPGRRRVLRARRHDRFQIGTGRRGRVRYHQQAGGVSRAALAGASGAADRGDILLAHGGNRRRRSRSWCGRWERSHVFLGERRAIQRRCLDERRIHRHVDGKGNPRQGGLADAKEFVRRGHFHGVLRSAILPSRGYHRVVSTIRRAFVSKGRLQRGHGSIYTDPRKPRIVACHFPIFGRSQNSIGGQVFGSLARRRSGVDGAR
mmetsp:Transcript_36433/g.76758  ORF Transcript_36433/g.76758 Transcript_36433/m.76758 type:complete len:223 (+) Transcript_36433:2189-2857(+)